MEHNYWKLLISITGCLLVSCQQNGELILQDTTQSIQFSSVGHAVIDKISSEDSFELTYKNSVIPHQISGDTLFWIITPENYKGPFQWSATNSQANHAQVLENKEVAGQLEVHLNHQKLVGYQMDVKESPNGVNPAFRRSGYIHPLNTPNGNRLTRIQPEDHYHHYGLWNPWTHTLVEGDTVDFWNLAKEEGTVRFAELLSEQSGPVFSEFKVRHEHVVLLNNQNKVALIETQKIRVTPISNNAYYLDFEINYTPPEKAFKIIEYRYGGFSWRATEEWDKTNSRVLSSEGNTRENADGSLAKWYLVEGALGDDYGGALIMSSPKNFNHPEPLRIWPESLSGPGDVFTNFATTKNTDWIMEPGKSYSLRYRMIIYDGQMDTIEAVNQWEVYAQPLQYTFN